MSGKKKEAKSSATFVLYESGKAQPLDNDRILESYDFLPGTATVVDEGNRLKNREKGRVGERWKSAVDCKSLVVSIDIDFPTHGIANMFAFSYKIPLAFILIRFHSHIDLCNIELHCWPCQSISERS